jgi:hypothetical protein
MAYVYFKTCLALAMAYILVKMGPTLHVPFGTLAMVYILVKMHLAPIVIYILIRMRLAFHVLFKT